MKKSITIINMITIAFLLFIFSTFFTGCVNKKNQLENARYRIQEITNIEIPTNAKTIYNYQDNVFVNGRRAQLAVFEFENEPTSWLAENNFLYSNDETITEEIEDNKWYFEEYFGFMTIAEEYIPKEYTPNFDVEYYLKEKANVYFFYYPNTFKLIVFIAGS